jgi:aminopeptidase
LLDKLADLAVRVGMNVQPGQVVAISTDVGKEHLTRIVARAAYAAGARFVDVQYFDVHIKRVRLELAAEETLDFVPPWYGARMLALGETRAARLALVGPVAPDLLADLDHSRVGLDRLPWIAEILELINDRTTNWSSIPCPTPAWARLVHPELPEDEALGRLNEEIAFVCRLDGPDPAAAWRERLGDLADAAGRLTDRHFDALHFEGPGTDLRVGLLPSSHWATAEFETVEGIGHVANLPTEEVFTSPDPARTEGIVRATKPLVFVDGTVVSGLRVRFDGGRAVEIDAEQGADVIRKHCEADEGAARLGEIALVDRLSRIGSLGTVFFTTLLDENAASHIAFGNGFDFVVDESDRARRNASAIHIDFMIGDDDVAVSGITHAGERVPVPARRRLADLRASGLASDHPDEVVSAVPERAARGGRRPERGSVTGLEVALRGDEDRPDLCGREIATLQPREQLAAALPPDGAIPVADEDPDPRTRVDRREIDHLL